VGWLVQASLEGVDGYGDCAPLPEAGTEVEECARKRLLEWSCRFGAQPLADQLALLAERSTTETPAADAAIETALLDLDARRRGLTLRVRLSEAPPAVPSSIRVNAALGGLDRVQESSVDAVLRAGFDTLKFKVGVAALDEELTAIARLCQRLPARVRLRLDANRAWNLAEADQAIAGLLRWADRIESLEEPLREPSDQNLEGLQRQAPFSIALDESLSQRPQPIAMESIPVRRLVLKPGVVGGLRRALDLARHAVETGREVVVTSLIESAAGVWASAQLAAATGSPLAHGLATSDWLVCDLGAPPAIDAGRIPLSLTAGSGFQPYATQGRPCG
jgi:o-succinylbenzoate synthase